MTSELHETHIGLTVVFPGVCDLFESVNQELKIIAQSSCYLMRE